MDGYRTDIGVCFTFFWKGKAGEEETDKLNGLPSRHSNVLQRGTRTTPSPFERPQSK
ncbi:hypothetical protein CHS0354_036585, partial [Potamilus streckersoni]